MNIFILHAHPEPKAYSSALKDLAVEHFQNLGHQVVVSDLYKMNFNPVAERNDFIKPANQDYFNYMKEQMNAYLSGNFADSIKEEMDKLVKADLFILNFPLWWSSMPAIMKGWFDKVFAFGFAYHPKDKLYNSGVFKGKRAMLSITAGGSKSAYSGEGEHGDIMNTLHHINHGMLCFTGMTVLPPFIAWRAHLSTPEVLDNYLMEYKKHLENLDNLKPLY